MLYKLKRKNSVIKVSTVIILLVSVLFSWHCFGQENEDAAELTEVWEPVPPTVISGDNNKPPSDAIVLIDSKNLTDWESEAGGECGWLIEEDIVSCDEYASSIYSKLSFGDCQLHVEWMIPEGLTGEGQSKGNSGIFLQKRYEIQILDSYQNETYCNGQAGAIYKQHVPLVNVSKKPGKWQSFDIIFLAPRFRANGTLEKPGFMTVFHNGVLIHNHAELKGITKEIGEPEYEPHNPKEPLMLQGLGYPVKFKNIWIREL